MSEQTNPVLTEEGVSPTAVIMPFATVAACTLLFTAGHGIPILAAACLAAVGAVFVSSVHVATSGDADAGFSAASGLAAIGAALAGAALTMFPWNAFPAWMLMLAVSDIVMAADLATMHVCRCAGLGPVGRFAVSSVHAQLVASAATIVVGTPVAFACYALFSIAHVAAFRSFGRAAEPLADASDSVGTAASARIA